MADDFSKSFFAMVANSEYWQDALLEQLESNAQEPAGHHIPTGTPNADLLGGLDEAQRETIIRRVNRITIKELAGILGDLRAFLSVKEASGERLKEYERTLKDIDIQTLALVAFIRWHKETHTA